MAVSQLAAAGAVLALTVALMPAVLALLRRLDVIDHPTERSSHDRATLRGGGLAPAVATLTVAAAAASAIPASGPRAALLVAGVGFTAVGLVDDLRGVEPLPRFLLQLAVATVASAWLLASLQGSPSWRLAAGVAVVLWLVAYVNAFNFMDGINGIAAAQALVAGLAFAAIGTAQGQTALAGGGLLVAGAAAGFAPFNFPSARVFMGDVGSYFFGAWLAVLVVVALTGRLTPEAAFAPVSVWLVDTGVTLAFRIARREVWHRPHRSHVYQRLTQLGWSHQRVTLTVAGIVALAAALGAATLVTPLPLRLAVDGCLAGVLVLYLLSPRLAAGSSAPARSRVG